MAKKNQLSVVNNNNEDELLIEELREVTSSSKIYSLRNEAEFDVQYPTGFLNLDYQNGQKIIVERGDTEQCYYTAGIVDGSINMFIGRSGSGKSTIAKQAAANIVRPFPHGVIIEASIEGGITSRRNEILTNFGPNEIHSRLRSRNAGVSIESCYAEIKAIRDLKIEKENKYRYDTGIVDSRGNRIFKFQPTVYIIDSLAMLTSEKFTQEEELSGQMSQTATAKNLAQFFRRIVPIIKEANIILFVINHITQKVEINPFSHSKSQNMFLKQDETTPGGVTPFYVANNVFRLDDSNKLTEDKEFGINGCHVTVTLVKSRTNIAGSTATLIFNQQTGFDPDLSLYMMLKERGRINGAGAYLYIGDRSDKKFSQKTFKSKLREDPELLEIFINECQDCLLDILDKQDKMIQEAVPMSTESILSKINQNLSTVKVIENNN